MSFPRYPGYKDSGVEWLGEVPEDWDISRLGFVAWVRARLGWKGLKAEEYVDDGFAFLSTPNLKGDEIDFENVNFIDQYRFDESPEIKLRVGDVLLAKDGSTLGTVNVVRALPRPTTVNSSIAVITPNSRLGGVYLYYLFESSFMEHTIQRIKGGMGVPHLFQADLNKFYLPLPSQNEQIRIAAFLDRETAKIDGLVREQTRLIELLKEKRKAVIFHAVTKGLNPLASMNPSDIGWLGDKPEHWPVKVLKRFSTLQRGHDLTDAARTEGVYPVVTSAGISGTHGSFISRGPGVVTGRYGSTGRLFYIEGDFWPHNTSLYVSDFHGNNTRFVWYSLQTVDFAAHSAKAAVPGIDRNDIHILPVVVPPKDEQAAIAAFLDCETAKLDALVVETQRAIELLQERRTALISAAVTGKFDVRGLVKTEAP